MQAPNTPTFPQCIMTGAAECDSLAGSVLIGNIHGHYTTVVPKNTIYNV